SRGPDRVEGAVLQELRGPISLRSRTGENNPQSQAARSISPFSPYQLLRRVCPSPGGPPSVPPTFDLELPARRITGWEPVEDYPDSTEWPDFGIEADDDAADALCTLGYQPRQEDKLLGWPSWPQYVNYPNCRVCGRQLWQVFQLESHQNLWYMFGDDGNGHITCCPDHPDELAFQWSSY